jgi:hypothetical protein
LAAVLRLGCHRSILAQARPTPIMYRPIQADRTPASVHHAPADHPAHARLTRRQALTTEHLDPTMPSEPETWRRTATGGNGDRLVSRRRHGRRAWLRDRRWSRRGPWCRTGGSLGDGQDRPRSRVDPEAAVVGVEAGMVCRDPGPRPGGGALSATSGASIGRAAARHNVPRCKPHTISSVRRCLAQCLVSPTFR